MKKQSIQSNFPALALAVAATLILVMGAVGCSSAAPQVGAGTGVSTLDSDQDGIPDAAEQVLGTDPLAADTDGDGIADAADEAPTTVEDPFQSSSGPKGFRILDILVENNYDPAAHQDAPDHLELHVQNTAATDITDMVVHYVITDLRDNRTESYLVSLNGFVLKAGETGTIHFDEGTGPNHFRANPSGLYAVSTDELLFSVTVSADGYQAQQAEVKKDAGGAEVPD